MKILILGATGQLGGLVAHELTRDRLNVDLRLTSSRAAGAESLRTAFPRAEVARIDWYKLDELQMAVSGVDRILLITPDFSTDGEAVARNLVESVQRSGSVDQIVSVIAIPPGLSRDMLSREVKDTNCGAALHTALKPVLDRSGLPITYVNVACWIMFNLSWFMAGEVRENRRIAMPASSDAPRQWIAETDVSAVLGKILTDPTTDHINREYLLAATERFNFKQVAALIADAIGESVSYEDHDASVRAIMGPDFDKMMVYFTHETRDYLKIPPSPTVERLLGRKQLGLAEYIQNNIALFA